MQRYEVEATALATKAARRALVADSTNVHRDADWGLIEQQIFVIPETTDLMTWRIGDHGFQMTLSPRISDLAKTPDRMSPLPF